MEWRIFVPCKITGEMGKASSLPLVEARLEEIVHTLYSLRPISEVEERRDTYLVGNKLFGLKLRSGEKWELKTLLPMVNDIGVERYTKVKLGKKKLSHYESEILDHLRRHGHHQDHDHRDIIQRGDFLEVKKARTAAMFGNVCVEVADLELITPCNVSKHWCSLSVESIDLVDIQSFVASNILIRRLLHGVAALFQSAESHLDHPIAFPILGGYPAWIEYCAKSCPSSVAKASFEPALRKLLH